MKKSLTSLTVFLTVLMWAFSASAVSSTILLELSQNQFKFDTSTANQVSVAYSGADYSYLSGANSPALPIIALNVPIPANSSYTGCSVQVVNKDKLYSNVSVSLAPPELPVSESADGVVTATGPFSGIISPASSLNYSFTSTSKDGNIVHLSICPFEYNSSSKVLYFASELIVTINYTSPTVSKPVTEYNPELKELFQSCVNVPVEMNTGIDLFTPYTKDVVLLSNNYDYVIITNKELAPAFEMVRQMKTALGVRTMIITVEEIEKKFTGSDTQEKIKKQLQDLKRTSKIKYVLLGGDNSVVPVRHCYVKYGTYTASTPADNYYVCFGGAFDWDANGNGIYGEIDDNIDFTTQLFISRLPVRTVQEVENYAKNLFNYQLMGPNGSAKNQILMAGTKLWQDIDNNSDAYWKGEELYNSAIRSLWNGTRVRFYDSFTDLTGGASYNLTAQNLQTELSKGYSFVDIMTHGDVNCMAMETGSYFTASNASLVDNYGYTILTTMACFTNAFDSATDPCLSEAFIRNSKSNVIGYLGSSRYGWGTYGKTLGTSLRYEKGFYQDLFNSNITYKNFAKCVTAAKMQRLSYCSYYGTERWIQMSLNAIGDPEFEMYTTTPGTLSEPRLEYSEGRLMIETSDSEVDITVCSLDDAGIKYYHSLKNSKGSLGLAEIDFSVTISLHKPGYLPKVYTGTYIPSTVIGGDRMVFSKAGNDGKRPTTYGEDAEIESVTPAANLTKVRVRLNENAQNAVLVVSDLMGNTVGMESLTENPESQEVLLNLSPGFYVVTLTADGSVADQAKYVVK